MKENQKFDGLKQVHFWAYGVGHCLNDLLVACWFNFLLYFLKKVVHTQAGAFVFLFGQVFDGIATAFMGLVSDRMACERFGKRISWYLIGAIMVSTSFVPLFIVVNLPSQLFQYIYYGFFSAVFSIGWAFVQISHMSLVPSLTVSRKRRDYLNSLRNSFSFLSNVLVLLFGFAIFSIMQNAATQYLLIAVFSLTLGLLTTGFFLYHIREKKLSQICRQKNEKLKVQLLNPLLESSENKEKKSNSNIQWLKSPKFYLFGVCYICVRVYVNIFTPLLPIYLADVLNIASVSTSNGKVSFSLALVPLVLYLSSAFTSWKLTELYQRIGRKRSLIFGSLIGIFSLLSMNFLGQDFAWVIYFLCFFIGCSQSMVLTTGVNLISDVVGARTGKDGFVFGIYGFIDKILIGVIVYIVSNNPSYSKIDNITSEDITFIKLTLTLIPAAACFISSLILLPLKVGEYRKSENNTQQSSEDLLNKQYVKGDTFILIIKCFLFVPVQDKKYSKNLLNIFLNAEASFAKPN